MLENKPDYIKHDELQDNESTEAELRAKIKMLEEKIAKSHKGNDFVTKTLKVRSIKSYKIGDYVSVRHPLSTDFEDGKVLEFLPGKSGVTVATVNGEVTIYSPENIKKQSDNA